VENVENLPADLPTSIVALLIGINLKLPWRFPAFFGGYKRSMDV
jgi:hypothetical protein